MKRCAAIAVALAASLIAGPVAAADNLDQRIAELMVRSGLDKQLESFPDGVRLGLQQARPSSPMSDAQYELLEDTVPKAYDPAALKQAVAKRLRGEISVAEIDSALTWLNSPLGRKITRLEEDSSTAEAYQQMQVWAQSDQSAPSAARVEQIRRFDKAVGASEFSLASQLHAQMAMVAALTATQPLERQRQAFDRVNAAFAQGRAQLLQGASQQTALFFAYAYRALPDEELDAYIAFAESPAGKKYHGATMNALDDAMVRATHNAGKVFGEALRSHKGGA